MYKCIFIMNMFLVYKKMLSCVNDEANAAS